MKKILHLIFLKLSPRYRRFDTCMSQAEYHINEAEMLVTLALHNTEDEELYEFYKLALKQHYDKAVDFKRHADCYCK